MSVALFIIFQWSYNLGDLEVYKLLSRNLGCRGKAGTVGDKNQNPSAVCCLVLIWVTGWAEWPNSHWLRGRMVFCRTHTLWPTCNRFNQGHLKKGTEANFESDSEKRKSNCCCCSAAQNPEGNDHRWLFTTRRQQQDGDALKMNSGDDL